MDYLISFLIGGVICALVQILLDRTKLMPGRVMVCLVCGGVILGFAGLYQPFQDFSESRSKCAAAWIWKCFVERGKRSGR